MLKEVRGLVQDGTKEYLESTSDFRNYLIAQNTDDSNRELVAIYMLWCVIQDKVKVATKFIDKQLPEVKYDTMNKKISQVILVILVSLVMNITEVVIMKGQVISHTIKVMPVIQVIQVLVMQVSLVIQVTLVAVDLYYWTKKPKLRQLRQY